MGPRIASKLIIVLVVGLAGGGLIPGWDAPPGSHQRVDAHRIATAVIQPEAEDLVLLSQLRCVACHEATWNAEAVYPNLPGPSLVGIGSRAPRSWLEQWLLSPKAIKPGTHMPEVLQAMPTVFRTQVAKQLAAYLSSFGTPQVARSTTVDPSEVSRGRSLYHRVGCVACHAPEAAFEDLSEPEPEISAASRLEARRNSIEELRRVEQDPELFVLPGTYDAGRHSLTHLSGKTSVATLTAFLRNPLKTRPSGLMPSLDLSAQEARDIACYLLRDQREAGGGMAPGLAYEIYSLKTKGGVAVFEGVESLGTGTMAKVGLPKGHPKDSFSLRLSGWITIDTEEGDEATADEEVRFFLNSDDGSRLLIDGELVIANDGTHPPKVRAATKRLSPGRHAIEIQFYEAGGGEALDLDWERKGPSIKAKRQAVPASALSHGAWSFRSPGSNEREAQATPDGKWVEEGRHWFQVLRCDACHKAPEARDAALSKLPGKNNPPKLEDLQLRLGSGSVRHCIQPEGVVSEASQKQVTPVYALSDDQRTQLVGVLSAVSTQAVKPASAQADLLLYGCYTCHRRDEIGGVHPGRQEYFVLDKELDVGDEGRLPPHLSGVGRKLRKPWLEGVLLGTHRAHPHMATRMPYFGLRVARAVMESVLAEDAVKAPAEPRPYREEDVRAGQQLTGIEDGLGCIRCHGLGDLEALGIPAVKLDVMWERLNYGWFKDLLLDPHSVNMGTRMPAFFDDGKSPVTSILKGDARNQVDAIWHYLASGSGAPIPPGLAREGNAYQVEPQGRPAIVGLFMNKVSPRVLAIGHEDRVHAAFDVANARFVALWKGDFLDARGTWEGRAGKLLKLNPRESLTLPSGPTVKHLLDPSTPWPSEADIDTSVVRRRDDKAGFPHFTVKLADEATWTESVRPIRNEKGLGMRRELKARRLEKEEAGATKLWWRVAVGNITKDASDITAYWLTDPKRPELRCRIEVGPASITMLRPGKNQSFELVIQLQELNSGDTRPASVTYWW